MAGAASDNTVAVVMALVRVNERRATKRDMRSMNDSLQMRTRNWV